MVIGDDGGDELGGFSHGYGLEMKKRGCCEWRRFCGGSWSEKKGKASVLMELRIKDNGVLAEGGVSAMRGGKVWKILVEFGSKKKKGCAVSMRRGNENLVSL